ncbi:unnamed protein product [Victoria cruziana]
MEMEAVSHHPLNEDSSKETMMEQAEDQVTSSEVVEALQEESLKSTVSWASIANGRDDAKEEEEMPLWRSADGRQTTHNHGEGVLLVDNRTISPCCCCDLRRWGETEVSSITTLLLGL